MRNEFLFMWVALLGGWMDTIEQPFRLLSLFGGITFGIVGITTTVVKFYYWLKDRKNGNIISLIDDSSSQSMSQSEGGV